MSSMLGFCIDEAQGAFIPGRHISDNTLIAYEVLHSLKMRKRCKRGNFALTLDMSKAYDRIEWDFLAGMMLKLGFYSDWVVLVMRHKLTINHLLFTDDCILFGDATVEGARLVQNIIKEYEVNSGQQVNFDKSLIYFGASVGQSERDAISSILGVRVATNPKKYLGLPMMVGRNKRWAFANFVDRFRQRIKSWSLRYLSMGGKEVFIKAILQANPVYVMQCFALPKTLCQKLEVILNKF
ncbi:hypothetical protein PVK06_045225 [Gossypium arboreum]|uniref:Reverse transcriptase n=1 Tax=Gossypium arboreum TaxID=29729 RepID=A0ABR0MU07_GOSAR|nr:hypothetical protein PVK06_045225 [Gossypium arboreum]